MELRFRIGAAFAALALGAGGVSAIAASARHAGPRGDSTGVTPNGWQVTPAGRQIDIADSTWWADRPLNEALSPDGRWLLVTSNGQSQQSLKVVAAATGEVAQTIAYTAPEALFVGIAWSPDGTKAYAAAGGNNKVRRYTFSGGMLTETAPLTVPGYPAGLTLTPDGSKLLVAENMADAVGIIDLATAAITNVPLGACSEGAEPVQYPTSTAAHPAQCQPYGVALSADGKTAYVSNWGERSVTVVDVASRTMKGKITVGTHPSAMTPNPDASRNELYVANGDSDSVSVIDTRTNAVTRTYDLSPYAGAPAGSNPDALSVSPDGRTLYVANAGNNDVVVIDLTSSTRSIRGMIPTAWYPTAVVPSKDGETLLVLNAKGLGAGPNPGYQQGAYAPPTQYVGSMMHGTLSLIPTPNSERLNRYTEQVTRNNGFSERDKVRSASTGDQEKEGGESAGADGSPIPRRVGDASPIKHVIYIIKENRTFDQVFGSLGKGDGDPDLNLFGDESATNIRSLARRFVTLDNFYASAEVSADGWNWSVAGNANGYVQRSWPANYSDVNRGRGYDFEGGNYATAPNRDPHNAYLWDRLASQQRSYRNYGFYTVFGAQPSVPQPTAKNLAGHTAPSFPGYNLAIADSPCGPATLKRPSRFSDWNAEFKQFEANNNLPDFEFLRLPNDHTRGTTPGAETPKRYVADNDYAVGRVVQAVSHSKFWSSTAIFVVEDDAQDGADHVDAHRTEALVISPYTQLGKVDSTLYSTVSMLRTIELIMGLQPLTQFDAAATPMLNSFSRKPNLKSYDAAIPPALMPTPPDPDCPAGQNATREEAETNDANSPLAEESAAMNFDTADAPDNRTLNEAIWQSVKGSGNAMPPAKNATMSPSGTPARDGDG